MGEALSKMLSGFRSHSESVLNGPDRVVDAAAELIGALPLNTVISFSADHRRSGSHTVVTKELAHWPARRIPLWRIRTQIRDKSN